MARLTELGLATSPLDDPLSYPGRLAPWSGLLVGDHFLAVGGIDGRDPAEHLVVIDEPIPGFDADLRRSQLTLRRALARLGVAGPDDRAPVLSFGSNASPGQMRAKLVRAGVSTVLPMIMASVDGWRPTVSAHVSRPGYLPITACRDERARGVATVILLCDPEQLAAVDRTEANYQRIGGIDGVVVDGGRTMTGCHLYLGEHGALGDHRGRPVRWRSERAAIETVIALLPALAARSIRSPADFVARCRVGAMLRTWVRDRLRIGGHTVAVAPPDGEERSDPVSEPPAPGPENP